MKQEKKLEECHKKQKSSNEETKQLKIKLNQAEKVVKELRNRLELENGSAVDISIKCNECEFSGRNMEELTEHKNSACSEALIRRLTEEGPLNVKDSNCEKCSYQNTNRVLLNEHKERAHKGPIKCVTCGDVSLDMKSFREHGKKHMAEIKQRNSPYPGMANNFKCTPCKVSFKSHKEMMDHISEEHLTKDQGLGTGLKKYENPPLCRNGNQCRYHRQYRCMFLHNTPPQAPQRQQGRPPRQSPSSEWKEVPSRWNHVQQGQAVHRSHELQAQGHKYWSVPPQAVLSAPWCLHGKGCPMGQYCVLRHEDMDFPNWSPQNLQ